MPDPSAGEIGGIFAGVIAALVAFGHGIRWLLGWEARRDATRSAKLDVWQRELTERERKIDTAQAEYHASIERRLAALVKWAVRMQTKHAALWNGYQQVVVELRHHDPDNLALSHADEMMKLAIPLDPNIPAYLLEMLSQINGDDEDHGGEQSE